MPTILLGRLDGNYGEFGIRQGQVRIEVPTVDGRSTHQSCYKISLV